MEVQSGVQQPEPRSLGSPRSGANQQDEFDDRQTDASSRPSADNHSKDAQPASQKDDKKPSAAVRGYHSSKAAAASGSSGGQGSWSGPSFTRTNLQHYLSHHQQHPHHHPQSQHTSYAYCPAHTAVVETLQPAGLCLDPPSRTELLKTLLPAGLEKEEAVCSARSLSDEPPLPPCQCG